MKSNLPYPVSGVFNHSAQHQSNHSLDNDKVKDLEQSVLDYKLPTIVFFSRGIDSKLV